MKATFQPFGQRLLVTGAAGFLGSHLTERLLDMGNQVVGVDSFNDYYSPAQKEANVAGLRDRPGFELVRLDLSRDPVAGLLDGVDAVFHLAAQPGVRGSFGDGFDAYLRNNVQATQRLLEEAAARPVKAFVYASSSAVYGDQAAYPTTEAAEPLPISPYGMTKMATEHLAHLYLRSNGVPAVGLRYFTAYGPRQRPDMAFARFLARALASEPITVFGDGGQRRDFTYVDDVVLATIAAASAGIPGTVYNIGGGTTVTLTHLVELLGELLGRPVAVEHVDAQRGDVRCTSADTTLAAAELGFAPRTNLREGLACQLEWTLRELAPTMVAA